MAKLILLRHGQSAWNEKNLFTGWVDIPLTEKGIKEAKEAGRLLSEQNIDEIYLSSLIRAQLTAFIAMVESRVNKVPYIVHDRSSDKGDWYEQGTEGASLLPAYVASELNERMYGALQGKNKEEVKKEHGEEQFKLWRRSYDTPPPNGEALKQTAERTLPYFQSKIEKSIKEGKDVLVCAHGNSLRAIVMYIENLSKEEVLKLEIPTGEPRIYEHTGSDFVRI